MDESALLAVPPLQQTQQGTISVIARQTPEQVDQNITRLIQQLTAEDSSIWTSPDFDRREYIHSFFQYPAMMVPVVQKNLMDIIISAKPTTKTLLDPFMGSSTTLVSGMELGLDCYGQDINPMAVLISKVRTGPYYVEALKIKYQLLWGRIRSDRSTIIEAKFSNRRKWFKDKVSRELSKIVRAIRQEERLSVRRLFWLVLAETVRLCSNDRTSTFKLHVRPEKEIESRDISAIEVFNKHMLDCIDDMILFVERLNDKKRLSRGAYNGQIDVRLWNSKEKIYSPLSIPFYDLVVTSPPYGDNHTTVTYGQHSYLPLQWIDMEDIDEKADKSFLRTTQEIDRRSLGGKISGVSEELVEVIKHQSPSFCDVLHLVNRRDPQLVKKVKSFICDLSSTIDNIMLVMKPNGYQVWTVGNRTVGGIEVDNSRIIQEIIEARGGTFVTKVEREILNKRMAKRNKDVDLMTTEDILIFRKRG